MTWKIVQSIIDQINNHPNANGIKKLLYYKLSIELGSDRCTPDLSGHTASTPDMVDFTEGIDAG